MKLHQSNKGPMILILAFSFAAVAIGGVHAAVPDAFPNNCSACHGISGEGNPAMGAPVLAGLDKNYLRRQVAHFLDGSRPVPKGNFAASGMVAMLKGMNPEELEAAIDSASKMRPPGAGGEVPAPNFKVRNLVSGCTSCHGGGFQGSPELSTPRLAFQNPAYLTEQIRAFRSGQRGLAATDKYGKQMRVMAQAISSNEDVEAIVKYIRSLSR